MATWNTNCITVDNLSKFNAKVDDSNTNSKLQSLIEADNIVDDSK